MLAAALDRYRGRPGLLVIGLARGGVPVAAEVAAELRAPLDVAVVRKLGVPGHEELALGAISDLHMTVNDALLRSQGVSSAALDAVIDRERRELGRRSAAYRAGRPAVEVTGRTVLLVDDGLATGATMRVAVRDMQARGAAAVIVAVPTAPRSAAREFAGLSDDFVCPYTPEPFGAVGMFYRRFPQVDDDELLAVLRRADATCPRASRPDQPR
ncbi:MAG: phosphoribosyltransferase family protein [Mycobacterium sp.]